MRILSSFLLAVALLAGATAAHADATLPLDPSLFPDQSMITYYYNVPNYNIDQNWSSDSYGNALFHTQTEDSLGRVTGWVEQASYQPDLNSPNLEFSFVVSTYDYSQNADRATTDFSTSIVKYATFNKASSPKLLLGVSNLKAFWLKTDVYYFYAATFTSGIHEVEAAMSIPQGYAKLQAAGKRDFISALKFLETQWSTP